MVHFLPKMASNNSKFILNIFKILKVNAGAFEIVVWVLLDGKWGKYMNMIQIWYKYQVFGLVVAAATKELCTTNASKVALFFERLFKKPLFREPTYLSLKKLLPLFSFTFTSNQDKSYERVQLENSFLWVFMKSDQVLHTDFKLKQLYFNKNLELYHKLITTF